MRFNQKFHSFIFKDYKKKRKSYTSVPDSGAITSALATGSSKTTVSTSVVASVVDPSD